MALIGQRTKMDRRAGAPPWARRRIGLSQSRWRGWAVAVALAWGMGGAAQAQAPSAALRTGRPGQSSITSSDRRFMVSGLTSAENMVLANRLAELAARVEETTGLPLPMRRGQVMGVMVQSDTSPEAQVLKMQGWDDARFYQRLVVPGRYRLDGEDMLEGAGWLLLNRYAAAYTPAAQQLGTGATVPEWISVGVVQNSQPTMRSRNRDWISRELAEGRHMPLAQVIRQEVLPPGRWREKAYASAAVEFLFPPGDAAAWSELFRATGQRQAIDAEWLRKTSRALAGRHPEAAWQEHLAERSRARRIEAWSDRGLRVEEQLMQALHFRPRDLVAEVPREIPAEMFARDLIDLRGQEWVPPLAAALSLQVQGLRLGAPGALQEVLASYAAFLDQLAVTPVEKSGRWWRSRADEPRNRPPDDATWQIALNQLWLRAERAHQQYLERHQARKGYLDSFDRPVVDDFADPLPELFGLPRTRWQRYVDEIEQDHDARGL